MARNKSRRMTDEIHCIKHVITVLLPFLLMSSVVIIIIFNIQVVKNFRSHDMGPANYLYVGDDRLEQHLPATMIKRPNDSSLSLSVIKPVVLPPGSPVHLYNMSARVVDRSECVPLASLEVKICIHSIEKDKFVSQTLKMGRFWEAETVLAFWEILMQHPELHVIDLGANIGQFTLIGVYAGRQVIAVEPRLKHIQMLHHSLVLNEYQSQVTIVHNALSDHYERVRLGVYSDNQGGTHVLEKSEIIDNTNIRIEDNAVDTIILSDLVPVLTFNKAIIKMDIEGFEDKAMKFADALLDKLFVPHILMEWLAMCKKPESVIQPLLDWFGKRGYECFPVGGRSRLNLTEWRTWPTDIHVKHKSVD